MWDNTILAKWKTTVEPQGSNPDVLKKLIEAHKGLNYKNSDKIDEMLDILLKVSTAPKVVQKLPQKEKEVKPKNEGSEEVREIVEGWLQSALTKYDLDPFFKDNNIKKIVELLEKEVNEDIVKENQTDKVKKEKGIVKKIVSSTVGNLYKEWKVKN